MDENDFRCYDIERYYISLVFKYDIQSTSRAQSWSKSSKLSPCKLP